MDKLGILLPNLVIYIINFLLMMWLLRILLYKPVTNMLNQRRERIREGLAEAERVKEQAATERAALEAQFAEERKVALERQREATSRSEEVATRRLAEANTEAEEIVGRAREEATATRNNALAGLQNEIADLALAAVAKVLQEGIDETRHRSLVDKFLRDELGGLALSSFGERFGEAARELVQQAAGRVDLAGVKDVLSALEQHGAEATRLDAEVVSAVPLTGTEQLQLETRLRARHGLDLPISYKVDPAILGGLVVRVGDQMVDGSLASKLNQLRQSIAG